jgi:nitrile hydratase subunit beta
MTFAPGNKVHVSARAHVGHHRTPGYLKGRTGTVERVHDRFSNPETRAYGADGEPSQRLYLVGFELPDLWPEYRGGANDRLVADVFEHWLEPTP